MDIGKLNGYWEAHEEKEKSLFFFWPCFDMCDLSSSPEWNLWPLHWKWRVLTTEPPGKSPPTSLNFSSPNLILLRAYGSHYTLCVCYLI